MPDEVLSQLADVGITTPWSHQVATAEAAYSGKHVVVATGTASGKSLGYLLPAFASLSIAGRSFDTTNNLPLAGSTAAPLQLAPPLFPGI